MTLTELLNTPDAGRDEDRLGAGTAEELEAIHEALLARWQTLGYATDRERAVFALVAGQPEDVPPPKPLARWVVACTDGTTHTVELRRVTRGPDGDSRVEGFDAAPGDRFTGEYCAHPVGMAPRAMPCPWQASRHVHKAVEYAARVMGWDVRGTRPVVA